MMLEEDEDENGSSLDSNGGYRDARRPCVRLARAAGRSKKYPTVAGSLNRARET
jgi:hypothetical protein